METPRTLIEAIIRRTATLRDNACLKQHEIAEMLGISRNTYANYERVTEGRITHLPISLIPKFCEIVGVSPQFLLTGVEHPVIAAYNGLQGEDRVIVDKFLRLSKTPALDEKPATMHDRDRPYTHR